MAYISIPFIYLLFSLSSYYDCIVSSTDYYDALGVQKNATITEIRRAYHALALRHHPDKGGKVAEFQYIELAYSMLMRSRDSHTSQSVGRLMGNTNKREIATGTAIMVSAILSGIIGVTVAVLQRDHKATAFPSSRKNCVAIHNL